MSPCLDCKDPERKVVARGLCPRCYTRRHKARAPLPPLVGRVYERTASEICDTCGVLKTPENTSFSNLRVDGTRALATTCRACRRKKRRSPDRLPGGLKAVCANGHELTPENRRPSRRAGKHVGGCKTCHRDEERARGRRAGQKPRVSWMEREVCAEGHPLTPENRRRGRHAGRCLLCHRIRETRKYDEQAKAWVAIIVHDPCSYCGAPRGGTVEHILALKRGGTDAWDNLAGACHSCNARKRTQPLLQFMLRRLDAVTPTLAP